jgi:hypothetical protein
MKTAVLMATLALGMAGEAMAVNCRCGANFGQEQTTVSTLVSGKTACALRGSDRWQEFHASNGDVIDYKRGPSDPGDPSSKVGTWTATTDTVTYTYGSQSYNYAVCLPNASGALYVFCNTATSEAIPSVNLKSGQGPC